jgi:hypothetical protein
MLVCVVLGVIGLSSRGVAAQAQEPSDLVIPTTHSVELTWPQLLNGRSVEVCNDSARRIPALKAVPADFKFLRDGAPVIAAANVITVRLPRHGISAGGCSSVRIRAASELALDPGSYTGTLVLFAAGAGTARLPIQITNLAEKPAIPVGATDPAILSVHNPTPFSHSVDAVLLLKAPASGEESLAIGRGCTRTVAQDEKNCPFLGNLYQGRRIVGVYVRGRASENTLRHDQELPVTLRAFSHPVGAYEGTITVAGTPLAIKADAKDSWICAVAAILLALLVAFAPQFWNAHFRPKHELLNRAGSLQTKYSPSFSVGPLKVEIDSRQLDEYTESVVHSIESYAASVVELDSTSKAYTAIDATLKLAEDDAAVFVSRLEQALNRLRGALDAASDALTAREVSDTPAILTLAACPLLPGGLVVGEATERVELADELVPLLTTWTQLVDRVLAYAIWLKSIAAAPVFTTPDDASAELLAYAGVELWQLREAVFEATTASDLDRIRASGLVESAFGRVAYLATSANVSTPLPTQTPNEFPGSLKDIGYPEPTGPTLTATAVLAEPAAATIAPAKPVQLPAPRRLLLVGDVCVLALTLAVSVVAALSTVYFGSSFGTLEDYLTVIVVGLAAQLVLKSVLAQFSVLLHDFSPVQTLMPAKAVPALPPATAAS